MIVPQIHPMKTVLFLPFAAIGLVVFLIGALELIRLQGDADTAMTLFLGSGFALVGYVHVFAPYARILDDRIVLFEPRGLAGFDRREIAVKEIEGIEIFDEAITRPNGGRRPGKAVYLCEKSGFRTLLREADSGARPTRLAQRVRAKLGLSVA
jgi:hypothetical protein